MRKQFATILLAVLLVAQIAAAQEDAKSLLQQALFAEEAEQKLDKAAENYEKVISAYEDHRDYAVAALFRLAEVRRKQDRNDEAAKYYQRILQDFPDSNPQARLSRENLQAMGVVIASEAPKIPNDPDEDKELRRLMMLAENNPPKVWQAVVDQRRFDTAQSYASKSYKAPYIEPLQQAAEREWLRVITWLFDQAAKEKLDLTADLEGALVAAVKQGHRDACELIQTARKDKKLEFSLVPSLNSNHKQVAEWLIENGCDINNPGRGAFQRNYHLGVSPLAAAISWDDKYWVDRLIELNADVNRVEEGHNITPLMIACIKGHAPLVQRLLKLGADPKATEVRVHRHSALRPIHALGTGWTALHYAVASSESVGALLAAGVDPNAADSNGMTPLHAAAGGGTPQSIELLLKAGARIDSAGSFKTPSDTEPSPPQFTPLMVAASRLQTSEASDTVAGLIEAGADFMEKSPTGQNALDLCRRPINSLVLTERFRYPKLADKKSIWISFPESGALFETATISTDASDPPAFADAIFRLWGKTPPKIRMPNRAFRWERPVLRRRGPDGQLSKIEIDVMKLSELPELRWGDIIELTSSEPEKALFLSAKKLTGSEKADDHFQIEIPKLARNLLGLSKTARVTIRLPDEDPRVVTTRGGEFVRTQFSPIQESDILGEVHHPLNLQNKTMEDATVTRSKANGGNTFSLRQQHYQPMDGDVLTVTETKEFEPRYADIRLVEQETQFLARTTSIRTPSEDDEHAEKNLKNGFKRSPTLFQFISESYEPFTKSGHFSRSNSRGYTNSRSSIALADKKLEATFLERLKALTSAEREIAKPDLDDGGSLEETVVVMMQGWWGSQHHIAHPDFSSIRVRRVGPGGNETTIDIDLADAIAACTAETPAEDCRAFDIDLQAGDTVELRSHHDRADKPWEGFDEKTALFLEKALTYEITLGSSKNEPTTIPWHCPTVLNTSVGGVCVSMRDRRLRNFSAMMATGSTDFNNGSWYVRNGCISAGRSPTGSRTRRRSVVLPPSN